MTSLPIAPAGLELEDFFAALLQGTGHYVEKNIEDPNILELDIAATSYHSGVPLTRIFEVKGTEPRLGDIFKLLGRMTYLNLPQGAFVSTRAPRERERQWFEEVCGKIGVDFIVCDALEDASTTFRDAGFGETDSVSHAMWRYSYWIERRLVAVLRGLARSPAPPPAAVAALDYYRLINSGVFLTSGTLDKVRKLYEAYQIHPRLTADLAEDMAGINTSGAEYLRNHLLKGSHPELDATMYLEHRARLSILKAAVDYLREGQINGELNKDEMVIDFGIVDLPDTFLDGLRWLGGQRSYWLFPVFWQNLLWGWGGLLPNEHHESVTASIAGSVGMDHELAPAALEAIARLFPIPDGWFREFSSATYRFVALTPWAMQGLGAYRQLASSGKVKYDQYVTTGQYTASDFARRHNAAVKLLEGS